MVPQNWREFLLKMAASACNKQKISEATLGNKIVNDADFFPNIRDGRGCTVDTFRKVITWFSENGFKFPKHNKG